MNIVAVVDPDWNFYFHSGCTNANGASTANSHIG
jgi:hypothetical protein